MQYNQIKSSKTLAHVKYYTYLCKVKLREKDETYFSEEIRSSNQNEG